jgi:hypothetical protein
MASKGNAPFYFPRTAVVIITIEAAAMTPVASQPTPFSAPKVKKLKA